MAMREDRDARAIRPVGVEPGFHRLAEGSALYRAGGTVVLCTASVDPSVPDFMVGRGKGWITAEYQMHPRANPRKRENRDGRDRPLGGRAREIQRLIGRALRAAIDLDAFGERSVHIDCDVLEADGGTRTAAINGAMVALHDAFVWLSNQNHLARPPFTDSVAAISVGLVQGHACLDLDYVEDSAADVDMNVVMTGQGRFIEVQGTGERATFDDLQMRLLIRLARAGIKRVTNHQRKMLGGSGLLPE